MRGSEFFELAIAGELNANHVQALVETRTAEDQWIDFKSGKALQENEARPAKPGKPTEPAAKLRRYVSAMANAEGGCVVVGVTDKNDCADQIDGCRNVGAESPKVWAERVLAPLAYFATSPIRCVQLEIGNELVLVVAVGRSERLVPCIEQQQHVYYMRIGEQSPKVPEYLVADVLLGRRQRPDIDFEVEWTGGLISDGQLGLRVHIRNQGIVPVPSYSCGLLAPYEPTNQNQVPPGLGRYVALGPKDRGLVPRANLFHSAEPLQPFSATKRAFGLQIPTGRNNGAPIAEIRLQAVLFFAAANDLPRFQQITLRIEDGEIERKVEPVPPNARGVVALSVTTW